MRICLVTVALLWLLPIRMRAAESWAQALARMPLGIEARELNQTNCIPAMLGAFRSNEVVKAMVFLPGAADEFYLLHRASARLSQATANLLDTVQALTNQTHIQATFVAPLLLLHTTTDRLEPAVRIEDVRTVEKLKARPWPGAVCIDRDWDYVQVLLKWPLKLEVRPWQHSPDSYHFYRHNFAAFGLNGWEALETTALAGKTRLRVRRNEVVFELDQR